MRDSHAQSHVHAHALPAGAAAPASRGFWHPENRAVVLLTLAFGFVFFDRNALNFLTPLLLVDLKLSNTEIGLLSAGLSFTWAVSGFVLGLLADRSGRRRSFLIVTLVIFSLCSMASGFAVSFASLLAARMVMGLAEGPILPISQSMMVAESSPQRRGLNMGILQCFGASLLGGFAAPLVLVAIGEAHGWRTAFLIAGVPGIVLALFMLRWLREPPVTDTRTRAAVRAADGPALRIVDMLKVRNVWLCVLISICLVAWMVVGWAFLPLYYVQVRGFSGGQMSVVMAALGLAACAFGAFIGPGLSDRVGRKPMVLVLCLMGVLAPLTALFYSGPLPLTALLSFVGWAAAGAMPLVIATIPAETLPARCVATAIGLTQGIGEIIGGVGAPVIAGRLADLHGPALPMQMMVGFIVLAAVLSLGLVETAPRRLRALGRTPAPAL